MLDGGSSRYRWHVTDLDVIVGGARLACSVFVLGTYTEVVALASFQPLVDGVARSNATAHCFLPLLLICILVLDRVLNSETAAVVSWFLPLERY